MTEVIRWTGFAVAAAMLTMVLRTARKEIGMVAAMAAGVMLLSAVAERAASLLTSIGALAEQARISGDTLALLVKTLGAAYITEFACQACRDAGEEGIAVKVALLGRLLILTLAWPLFESIGRMIMELAP